MTVIAAMALASTIVQWIVGTLLWRANEAYKGTVRTQTETDIAAANAAVTLRVGAQLEQYKDQLRATTDAALKDHEARLRVQADTTIEHVKGEIRRDVEESLKTHESRLRLQAELRLRAHDREWELLRSFTAAAWVAFEAVVDYGLAIANEADNEERRGQAHQAAYDAITKLNTFSAAMPPRAGDVDSAIREFLGAFRACSALLVSDAAGTERGQQVVAIRDQAQRGVARTHTLAREWNNALWRESTSDDLVGESTAQTQG
ncbi:MAG: hypothetical protein ACRELB_13875 [Polyangiaceae bacterium]